MLLPPLPTDKFEALHYAFCDYMLAKSGTPFTSFRHPFLLSDEIAYKWRAYYRARDVLELETWKRKDIGNGRILEALRAACAPGISRNLLEHKYGTEKGSYKALYLVSGAADQRSLEEEFYAWFLSGDSSPEIFGPLFDRLADFLREHQLGAGWDFLSYLVFLRDPWRYFPIRPTRFQNLLDHLGYDARIAGKASWERYSLLLELAEQLRERLLVYGPTSAVDIQSYMWVLSNLLQGPSPLRPPAVRPVDPREELHRRQQRAGEQERIGLQGELYALEQERARLADAGRVDLARQVEHVAASGDVRAFDILSYEVDGRERHIEVKTTTRPRPFDDGFWLAETERAHAAGDENWCLYRVWDIDGKPTHENIGNIVMRPLDGWELTPASWAYRRP